MKRALLCFILVTCRYAMHGFTSRVGKSACNGLTLSMVMSNKASILLSEAKAFVKVRSVASVSKGKRSFKNIPTLKNDLLKKVVDMIDCDVHPRFYSSPVKPTPLVNEDVVSMEDGSGGV